MSLRDSLRPRDPARVPALLSRLQDLARDALGETRAMVEQMAPGSVIVDLSAERGGNCELTKLNQTVVEHDITIIGTINMASSVPYHASHMYARNLSAFLLHLVKEGSLHLDEKDEIINATLLTRDGNVVNSLVREFLSLPATPADKH